jgi:hypothetical protein
MKHEAERRRIGATLTWLIDRGNFHPGPEKSPCDTFGITTVLVKHLSFPDSKSVEFRFLGGNAVSWRKRIDCRDKPEVRQCLRELVAGKGPDDRIFTLPNGTRFSSKMLNDYLTEVMDTGDRFTVRQLQLHNACRLLEKALAAFEAEPGFSKLGPEQLRARVLGRFVGKSYQPGILDQVAREMGHHATDRRGWYVLRKYSIHPAILPNWGDRHGVDLASPNERDFVERAAQKAEEASGEEPDGEPLDVEAAEERPTPDEAADGDIDAEPFAMLTRQPLERLKRLAARVSEKKFVALNRKAVIGPLKKPTPAPRDYLVKVYAALRRTGPTAAMKERAAMAKKVFQAPPGPEGRPLDSQLAATMLANGVSPPPSRRPNYRVAIGDSHWKVMPIGFDVPTFWGAGRVDLEDAFEMGGFNTVVVRRLRGVFTKRLALKLLEQIVCEDLNYEHQWLFVIKGSPTELRARRIAALSDDSDFAQELAAREEPMTLSAWVDGSHQWQLERVRRVFGRKGREADP